MKKILGISIIALLMGGTAFAQKTEKAPKAKKSKNAMNLETDKQKLSYAIGRDIGTNLRLAGLDIDANILAAAINHGLADSGYQMDAATAQQVITDYQQKKLREAEMESEKEAAKYKAEAEAFLANNRGVDGVKETPSGLQYKVITEGTGEKPSATSRVKVHYKGTLLDGTKFDSSYDRNQPATFGLNQVIKGWTEGLQLMPVGSKYIFYIPSDLGYGTNPPPGSAIKPGSLLVFEVELLDIIK